MADCESRGIRARRIPVDYASHSGQVDALADRILADLAPIRAGRARVPFFSTVTGDWLGDDVPDAAYWVRNLRNRVRFEEAVRELAADGYDAFVECSAHPVLAGNVTHTLEDAGRDAVVTGSLLLGDGGLQRLLTSLSTVFTHGVPVDWARVYTGTGAPPRSAAHLRLPARALLARLRQRHRLPGRRVRRPHPGPPPTARCGPAHRRRRQPRPHGAAHPAQPPLASRPRRRLTPAPAGNRPARSGGARGRTVRHPPHRRTHPARPAAAAHRERHRGPPGHRHRRRPRPRHRDRAQLPRNRRPGQRPGHSPSLDPPRDSGPPHGCPRTGPRRTRLGRRLAAPWHHRVRPHRPLRRTGRRRLRLRAGLPVPRPPLEGPRRHRLCGDAGARARREGRHGRRGLRPPPGTPRRRPARRGRHRPFRGRSAPAVRLNDVAVHAPGARTLRARISRSDDSAVTLDLAEPSGRRVASIGSLRLRPADTTRLTAAHGATPRSLFAVEWEPLTPPGVTRSAERWAVLGDGGAPALETLRNAGAAPDAHRDLDALRAALDAGAHRARPPRMDRGRPARRRGGRGTRPHGHGPGDRPRPAPRRTAGRHPSARRHRGGGRPEPRGRLRRRHRLGLPAYRADRDPRTIPPGRHRSRPRIAAAPARRRRGRRTPGRPARRPDPHPPARSRHRPGRRHRRPLRSRQHGPAHRRHRTHRPADRPTPGA